MLVLGSRSNLGEEDVNDLVIVIEDYANESLRRIGGLLDKSLRFFLCIQFNKKKSLARTPN